MKMQQQQIQKKTIVRFAYHPDISFLCDANFELQQLPAFIIPNVGSTVLKVNSAFRNHDLLDFFFDKDKKRKTVDTNHEASDFVTETRKWKTPKFTTILDPADPWDCSQFWNTKT